MFNFSNRSLNEFNGVDPRLVEIANLALSYSTVDFGISEGLRDKKRQRYLYDTGKSWTMKSRHLIGEAIDVYAWVDGNISWEYKYYERIALAFYMAADKLNYKITWGGSWKTRDAVHVQIEN